MVRGSTARSAETREQPSGGRQDAAPWVEHQEWGEDDWNPSAEVEEEEQDDADAEGDHDGGGVDSDPYGVDEPQRGRKARRNGDDNGGFDGCVRQRCRCSFNAGYGQEAINGERPEARPARAKADRAALLRRAKAN